MRLDSLVNRGDYFSAHYLVEVLPKDLKKKDGLLAQWAEREKQHRADQQDDRGKRAWVTPRQGLRALGKPYFADRPYFADIDARRRDGDALAPHERAEWHKALNELHGDILRALGYAAAPRTVTIERTGREYAVPVIYADDHVLAVECHWAVDVDAALDADQAGILLDPVPLDGREMVSTGTKLASWLFTADRPRRYVLILAGSVIVLADGATWGEGRFLGVSLDIALGRNDPAEIDVIAALFGADSLLPSSEGGAEPLAELITNSRNHAVGVSKDLREGLKESVELIANEVLDRLRDQHVRPEDIAESAALAKTLGREALRYLYRILFLLYAEARPDLGILPTDDEDYVKGYSMARLGDLVINDLGGEEARRGFHLYESLDLLFRMVNDGRRPRTGAEVSEGEGLRFEPLKSALFAPESVRLICRSYLLDDDENRIVDTRLRNECLYRVLRKLMLAKGRRKERGGFISYAQLGINQLGAVYEGLMSYAGFIATEDLHEVAKRGDPSDGSWMIPVTRDNDYPTEVYVRRLDDNGAKTDEYMRYSAGSFVYRLSGRERETSASYYTPESLTKATVQLALKYRLDQDGTATTAREILGWKICEPALGSGAFLNEAINQVAVEYLRRRQTELRRANGSGHDIAPEKYDEELLKTKAYIALHNCYGVDLNDTAVELAEVSLWLNVMHPGLQAPWFGLHLRRGNSLIGAGRRVYGEAELTSGSWLKQAPEDRPFTEGPVPPGTVHHFLLPADGWGAVAGAKEAKDFAPQAVRELAAWRRGMRKKVPGRTKNGQLSSQLQRLQALAGRVEFLWDLVVQRLTISEREISRAIHVWGADWVTQPQHAVPKEKVYDDLIAVGTPHWRLKKVMDAWCALWFWPLDGAGLLDGTDPIYEKARGRTAGVPRRAEPTPTTGSTVETVPGFVQTYFTDSLFSVVGEQLEITELSQAQEHTPTPRKPRAPRKSVPQARPVIALKTLDDWLDFAEAVLGRVDIPADSLITEFSSLDDLEPYEDHLPGWMGMDSELRLAERFPWLHTVDDIVEKQAFFHWELFFAQIFQQGGFDVQVGNPPWVRPQWDESGVLAEYDPWFALQEQAAHEEKERRAAGLLTAPDVMGFVLAELVNTSAQVAFLGSRPTYELLTGTQTDLYRAFMCQVWAHSAGNGTAGLLHSDTHFTGDKEGRLRAEAYRRLRVHGDFVNAGQRFFPEPVGHATHFGVHIYGSRKDIGFDHLSWLTSVDALLASGDHDGSGEIPGIRYRNKEFDVRPHRARIICVDTEVLSLWRSFVNEDQLPVEQARLLFPVSTAELSAIAALTSYSLRLGSTTPQVASGYHEKGAKEAGLIDYNRRSPATGWKSQPTTWQQVVLKGIQLGVATPVFKRHDANSNDPYGLDLTKLPVDYISDSEYLPAEGRLEAFIAEQERWIDHEEVHGQCSNPNELKMVRSRLAQRLGVELDDIDPEELNREIIDLSRKRYTSFYRLAWRRRVSKNSERALYAALIPPGPAHIDAVHSLAMTDNHFTALVTGFWAALPLDYFVRSTGRDDLRKLGALAMPAPHPDHPLAHSLLLRTLRLNCLTDAYAELWQELFDQAWEVEEWACEWPHLAPLNAVGPTWNERTPLRTERARRSALVEIDALVAVWLGMSADALVAAYQSRFPVLQKFEAASHFDAEGSKLASYARTIGQRQTKETWAQFEAYQESPDSTPPPEGYTPPFFKADRESEYRRAHAVFTDRLRQAGWPLPTESDDAGGDR